MYKQAIVKIEVRRTFFSVEIPKVEKVVTDATEALGRLFEKDELLKLASKIKCVIDQVRSSYENILKTESYKRLGNHTITLVITMSDDVERFGIIYYMHDSCGLGTRLDAYETPGFSSETSKYRRDILEKYGFLEEPEKSEDRLVHVFCNGIRKDIPFNVYKQMKEELKGVADCGYTEI